MKINALYLIFSPRKFTKEKTWRILDIQNTERSGRFFRALFLLTKGGRPVNNVVEAVNELVLPILEEKNFELVDTEFVKEGNDWFLRVYIDKPGGIDIDECVFVSERLSEQLDITDPIPQAYFLEVSSPGAERPLKKEQDWENALANHEYIHVSLYQKLEGEKQYQGFLEAMDEESITLKIRIKTREKEITIPRQMIAKARLAIQF